MGKLLGGLAEFSSLRLLSSAFWVAWITIIYSNDIMVVSSKAALDVSSSLFTASTLALTVSFVFFSCAVDIAWRIVSNEKVLLCIAVATSVCTFLVGFEGALPEQVFWVAGSFTGVGTACLATRCAVLYAETEPRRATIVGSLGLILGALIYSMAEMVAQAHSPLMVLIITCCMPLFCVALSSIPSTETPLVAPDQASRELSPAFIRTVLYIGFVSFALSSIRGYYPKLLDAAEFSSSRTDVGVGLVLLGLVVIAVMATKERGARLGKVFYVMFIVSVAMVLPMPFLGIFASYSGTLASLANGVLALAAWCFLAAWSYRTGMTPVRVFGLGFGLYSGAMTLGFMSGDLFGQLISDDMAVVAATLYTLFCIAAAVALMRPGKLLINAAPTQTMMDSVHTEFGAPKPASGVLASDTDEAAASFQDVANSGLASGGLGVARNESIENSAPELAEAYSAEPVEAHAAEGNTPRKYGRFMNACWEISEDFGLSEREAEVFISLAKHKEVKQIAEELFVSFNTVRTHVRKVYGKLGVHNRKELDDLVNSYVKR